MIIIKTYIATRAVFFFPRGACHPRATVYCVILWATDNRAKGTVMSPHPRNVNLSFFYSFSTFDRPEDPFSAMIPIEYIRTTTHIRTGHTTLYCHWHNWFGVIYRPSLTFIFPNYSSSSFSIFFFHRVYAPPT